MFCQSCGTQLPAGSASCPFCGAAVSSAAHAAPPRHRSTINLVFGIALLLLGGALLIIFAIFSFQAAGPAITAIRGIPAAGGFWAAIGSGVSRFQLIPTVLIALSHLCWAFAGLFLLLAGIFAITLGRGLGQAKGAIVFMAFGLGISLLSIYFIFQDSLEATGIASSFSTIIGNGWWVYLLQLGTLLATGILITLKKNAQRRAKLQRATQRIQAVQAARVGSITSPQPNSAQPAPPPNASGPPSSQPPPAAPQ